MTGESSEERRKASKEALEKCAETVNRAMVSLLAVALFCLLTALGAADRSLVAPEATIKIPFAEAPISFVGFLVVAPLLLIVMTIYLHVFYGSWRELDAERRSQGLTETYPTLFSIDRKIGRLLTGLIFYWLAPAVLATIAWKAAARFEWGLPMAVATVLLTAGLVLLQFLRWAPERISRGKRLVSLGMIGALMVFALVVGLVTFVDFHFDLGLRRAAYWERPLNLLRADLKGAWLAEGKFRRAEYSYANLEGAVLLGADLQGATLIRANLSGADLSGAKLNGAVLLMANLRGATLFAADLSGADLTQATLNGAKLNLATLSGAKLGTAQLVQADLTGAQLDGADLSVANLREVNLLVADLSGAKLELADLSQANLTNANLSRADLHQADLRRAMLTGANLIGANLDGAMLSLADLSRASFSGASFGKALLYEVDFRGANLNGADLRETEGLTCAQLRAAATDTTTKLPDDLKCPKK